jgi:hypothetical protein
VPGTYDTAWVAGFLVAPVFAAEHARVVTDSFMTVSEALAALPEDAASETRGPKP